MDIWLPVVWLVTTFVLVLVLHRWLELHIQGLAYLVTGHPKVTIWVFFLISFPGTLVHELSHWLAAKVLLVPTGRIVLWPQSKGKNQMWLGSVQVAKSDPLRSSLIGLAPLVSGSVLVALIGAHLQLDLFGNALVSGNWDEAWQALSHTFKLPDVWLWLYLLFAIANRMLPSSSDRQDWLPVILFLGCLSVIVIALGWAPEIGTGTRQVIADIIRFLLYAFTLTVGIDVLVALIVALLEGIVSLIRRQRIAY